MKASIFAIAADAIADHLDDLTRILADSVDAGASIGFLAPLDHAVARQFWQSTIFADVAAGRRLLFGASYDGRLVGTVQLICAMPANQPHRCEVAKMIVHPAARRLGIGRALIDHALAVAQDIGKKLVTLDTRSGDLAEPIYASAGFQTAGIIPDYALDSDGRALHATTLMYRHLP